jgi:hypothetical protein
VADLLYDPSWSAAGTGIDRAHARPDYRSRTQYPPIYRLTAVVVFVLLAAGVIGMVLAPGSVTGLGVPFGFTLWAVLAWFVERRDQLRADI